MKPKLGISLVKSYLMPFCPRPNSKLWPRMSPSWSNFWSRGWRSWCCWWWLTGSTCSLWVVRGGTLSLYINRVQVSKPYMYFIIFTVKYHNYPAENESNFAQLPTEKQPGITNRKQSIIACIDKIRVKMTKKWIRWIRSAGEPKHKYVNLLPSLMPQEPSDNLLYCAQNYGSLSILSLCSSGC